jgi:hypothetical protein
MTSGSEGQRHQVWVLPRYPRFRREHRLAAPVPQRRVLVEQQRERGVGQGQAKEGVQEVIVGEQSGNSPEKN